MRKGVQFAYLTGQMQTRATLCLLLLLSIASQASFAAGINVGPGASFQLGNGSIVINCLDLTVSGQFFAGDGTVESGRDISILNNGTLDGGGSDIWLSGDWSNAGTFSPGLSSVHIKDGCGRTTSAMYGNSTFFSFEATTSSGKTLQPFAGTSQEFQENLVLMGMASTNLKIRSSSPGSWAFFTLEPGGTQLIQGVDVMDNNASGGLLLAPGAPSVSDSLNSGNLLNWFDVVLALDDIFADGFEQPD